MLIDSHCHLTERSFSHDIDKVIHGALTEGVSKMVCVGTNLSDSKEAIKLANKYENIYCTVGVYPHEKVQVADLREKLIALASNKKVVAIGECGLDYSLEETLKANQMTDQDKDRSIRSSQDQKELFRKQIGLAVQVNLPLIIHNRNANDDIITELSHYKETSRLRGVFHCFTGNIEFAKKVLDLGFYISFTGIITYKSGKHLEEVIKNIPKDKILIETDAPYLSVEGMRKDRNEPKYVRIVAKRLSEILKVSLEETAELTAHNAAKLFNI